MPATRWWSAKQTYKLSLLPSGIVRGTLSVIGNGVVLDPWALKSEVEKLTEQGVSVTPENLQIAETCPSSSPSTASRPALREDASGGARSAPPGAASARPMSTDVSAHSALPGPLRLQPSFPFVDRPREMATLRSLLPRAKSEGRRIALVGGEPGSGKSRLVREIAHQAAKDGALVLYGACDGVVASPTGRSWRRSTSWCGPATRPSCATTWGRPGAS